MPCVPLRPPLHVPPGLRVGHLLPTERIGACCIRCNRFGTHHVAELQRGFLPVYFASWLADGMTPFCRAKTEGGECGRWFVSPDDGCSDVG